MVVKDKSICNTFVIEYACSGGGKNRIGEGRASLGCRGEEEGRVVGGGEGRVAGGEGEGGVPGGGEQRVVGGGGEGSKMALKGRKRREFHHGLHRAIKFKPVFVFLYSVINTFPV